MVTAPRYLQPLGTDQAKTRLSLCVPPDSLSILPPCLHPRTSMGCTDGLLSLWYSKPPSGVTCLQ